MQVIEQTSRGVDVSINIVPAGGGKSAVVTHGPFQASLQQIEILAKFDPKRDFLPSGRVRRGGLEEVASALGIPRAQVGDVLNKLLGRFEANSGRREIASSLRQMAESLGLLDPEMIEKIKLIKDTEHASVRRRQTYNDNYE